MELEHAGWPSVLRGGGGGAGGATHNSGQSERWQRKGKAKAKTPPLLHSWVKSQRNQET